jgi:hypothetical protein
MTLVNSRHRRTILSCASFLTGMGGGTYDDDVHIHYSIVWKVTRNKRAVVGPDTVQDTVLAPSAFCQHLIQPPPPPSHVTYPPPLHLHSQLHPQPLPPFDTTPFRPSPTTPQPSSSQAVFGLLHEAVQMQRRGQRRVVASRGLVTSGEQVLTEPATMKRAARF